MTVDVEDVCTDDYLADIVLGAERLQALLPLDWRVDPDDDQNLAKTALPARRMALGQVLKSLDRRRPRITPEQLADVAQLRDAVAFGALEIIYRGAVDHESSPNVQRAKDYEKKFSSELASLQPDLIDSGATAGSLSVRMHRG